MILLILKFLEKKKREKEKKNDAFQPLSEKL